MGLVHFLMILTKYFFHVIARPSFSLLYPLFASIRAVESDMNYQQCLTYWVLFSITTILESALGKLFLWLPFWPYAKGIVTLLLVVPYFGGASYSYKRFIGPYFCVNSQLLDDAFPVLETKENEQNSFLDKAETLNTEEGEEEEVKLVISESESSPNYDTKESSLTRPAEKIQKEWSCALCLVTTTSKECLRKHLHGKKHKAKEEELKEEELALNKTANNTSLNKTNKTVFLESFNQISWGNLENLSGILSPVTRSIIWCTWKKPKYGWTKLNTDGSIDRQNSGFGGLFRDYNGDPICGYVSKAPPYDTFLVELWAIWRGLVLASNLGIRVIWVESDSLSVVKSINRKQPYGPKASGCLKDIWGILEKFEKYQVSHAWRESNRAADHLAKMDILGNSDVVLWPNSFPKDLCKIIKEDAQGKWYRRV